MPGKIDSGSEKQRQIKCPSPSSLTLRFIWFLCHSFPYNCLCSSAFYPLFNSFPAVLPAQLHDSMVMWDLAGTVCVWHRAAQTISHLWLHPTWQTLATKAWYTLYMRWVPPSQVIHVSLGILVPSLCIMGNLAFSPGDTSAFLCGRLRSWHCFHKVLFLERESHDHQGGHLPSQYDQLAVFGVCPWLMLCIENHFWNSEDSVILDKLPDYQGVQQYFQNETSCVQTPYFGQLVRVASFMQSMRKFLASIILPCAVPCIIPAFFHMLKKKNQKKNLLGMIRYVRNLRNYPSELNLDFCKSLHAPLQNVLCSPTEAETKVCESSNLW